MLISALVPLLLAQAAVPEAVPDRLAGCLEQARTDPAAAVTAATAWLDEVSGAERSQAQQCLGQAYVSLSRWEEAEQAFLAGRDALPEDARLRRAQLAAMAGNAALAERRPADALSALDLALGDADAAPQSAEATELAGGIVLDRARALAALGREAEAFAALERARRDAPQDPWTWLLSATLSRRGGENQAAQTQIERAADLAPADGVLQPLIGLEAGVIAMVSGREEAARKSWQSVIEIAPDSEMAETARYYLSQIEESQP